MSDPLTDLDALHEVISATPFGLLADLDGTLSPLAGSPAEARVSPRNLELLNQLSRRCLTAVVSGRDLPDLKRIVALPSIVYVGLHGAAWNVDGQDRLVPEAEPYRAFTAEAARDLAPLDGRDGIFVELKTVGIALHYRGARRPPGSR